MVSHHSSDDEHEVSDSKIDDKPSYDELQCAFNELHDGFLKLSRKFSKQKKTILNLKSEANIKKVELGLIQNLTCNNCCKKLWNLTKSLPHIKKKRKIDLDNVLSS